MVLKKYLIILGILLLSSCAKAPTEIIVDSVPIIIPVEKIAHPPAVALLPIKWEVVEIDGTMYFSLLVKDYEALAINMQEIKKYILSLQNVVKYYEDNI